MQEYHGGQDNHLDIKFIQDFSVTTNFLGPNLKAIDNIKNNIMSIDHYPPTDFEPYASNLKNFLFKNKIINNNIILGNGASEFIDLIVRCIECKKTWKPSKSDIQYQEYERSCKSNNLIKKNWDEKADIVCLINPNNPTGDYLSIDSLKEYITTYCLKSHILVDESMQPWFGENWREDSLISETDWIKEMAYGGTFIYIIHSWTKFFSCTGLRYGSLICPTSQICDSIKSKKIPWSVNILALKYIDRCINDSYYMKRTWNETKELRSYQVNLIKKNFPDWKIYGKDFLSWIWIDTFDINIADIVYKLCKFNGIPIRHGKFGYNKPTFIRIAVREKEFFDKLIICLQNISKINKQKYLPIHININSNVIKSFEDIEINKIKPHEQFIEERHSKLLEYLNSIDNVKVIPSIIICSKTYTVIDGHHRLSILKKLNYKNVPCILVNYDSDSILVNSESNLKKEYVINAALTKNFLTPKSTCHLIKDKDNNCYPIQVISPIIHLK